MWVRACTQARILTSRIVVWGVVANTTCLNQGSRANGGQRCQNRCLHSSDWIDGKKEGSKMGQDGRCSNPAYIPFYSIIDGFSEYKIIYQHWYPKVLRWCTLSRLQQTIAPQQRTWSHFAPQTSDLMSHLRIERIPGITWDTIAAKRLSQLSDWIEHTCASGTLRFCPRLR